MSVFNPHAFRHYRQMITDGGTGGVPGDCFRTAIGMCLGLPPSAVPHFVDTRFHDDWRGAARAWLAQRQLDMVELPMGTDHDAIVAQIAATANDVPVMLSGWAERGDLHSVVIFNGKIYDPHPSDAGLCAPHPIREGSVIEAYWLRFLAPRLDAA